MQGEITDATFAQHDDSTQLGYTSIFNLCHTGGNEVYYRFTLHNTDRSVDHAVTHYEDSPSGELNFYHKS